jgi:hypothetical protein
MADTTRDLEKAKEAFASRDVEASISAHDAKIAEGHTEDHKKSGEYIKSIIFGGMDGIITTFAVVSGATGGGLGIDVILILGFSNIIADALSMGVGDALSTKAENEFIMKEREREAWELENHPEGEKAEMYAIFEEKGLSKEDAKRIIDIMATYPDFFVDAMMHYELEVEVPGEDDNPWCVRASSVCMPTFTIVLGRLGARRACCDSSFVGCVCVSVCPQGRRWHHVPGGQRVRWATSSFTPYPGWVPRSCS